MGSRTPAMHLACDAAIGAIWLQGLNGTQAASCRAVIDALDVDVDLDPTRDVDGNVDL